ncbi:MipA/OmpV family protein [Thalassobaculum sp. OXR-137]|uniref:MipA/OmpV family protein n=1 Tax=Thalassobaculum sp. OXR-137 TaxID=3100173 RepID=UPI002AC99F56|nr:MipA/OmpV family protein [Thalassobaculum sp. OXR-137]WPZ33795.1 MipA/OmpV family protein [Thalassobaculum sp. OXR-137]
MNYMVCRNGVAAGLLMASVALPGVASAQDDWEFVIGAGVGYGSKYEGSDEMEAMFLPVVDVTWKDTVYLSTEDGLGAVVYDDNNFTVNVGFNYDWGREESDSSDLRGLGDVDGAVTANLSLEYDIGPVTPFLELTRHLGGTNGLEASFGVETMIPVSAFMGSESGSNGMRLGDEGESGPAFLAGLSSTWSDDKYMKNYFGVNSTQSARSGLQQYTAKSGLKSVTAELGFLYPVNENWEVMTMVEYSRLIGDAADSPISKDDGVVFGGLTVSYKF